MPVDPQLIDVFGEDLGGILTALEEGLNPQVQQLMAESLSTLQFDAKIFADQIEKRISMLAGAGMDEATIKQVLREDMRTGGRIFGELKNNVKGGMSQSINQSGRAGQMEAYKPTELLAWVTVGGHKVCPDCDARAGQTGTIEFWETNGLPGSGWSVCQGFCYCILDPTGKIDKRVQAPEKLKPEKGATVKPTKVPEKIKPITKPRAKKMANEILRDAKKAEAGVTKTLKGVAKGQKGKMRGLEFRLKTPDSLTRKILKVSDDVGANRVRGEMRDALRYTMELGDDAYATGINSTIAELEAQGWEIIKFKNTWYTRDYKGINTVFQKGGVRFELQFHTPKSLRVKMDYAHPLYEKIRVLPKGHPDIIKLTNQLEAAYFDVIPPRGTRGLGKIAKQRAGINEIDDLLGTTKRRGHSLNRELVTGRLNKYDAAKVWERIYESKEFKDDLFKYHEFLKKKGLDKMLLEDLHTKWLMHSENGEAFYRYAQSLIDGSDTHFAFGKYFDHDMKLQAAFRKKVKVWMDDLVRETAVKLEDFVQALKYDRQFNQNMLKRYGFVDDAGNVTVYRGVESEYFKKTGVAYPALEETGQMVINSAESWSTNEVVAEYFAGGDWGTGVIFRADVPLDRVISSNFSFAHFTKYVSEAEIILGGSEPIHYRVIGNRDTLGF